MPAKDLIFTVLGIDRASNVFDNVGKSMDRTSKVGTKSMAALLAASLGASAGIAAALGGVGVVFAATAGVALSQNAAVANSFRALGTSMKSGLVADAGVLEDEMVGAATDINAAFQDLRPELRAAFSAAQPYVENLTDGVTGFARKAMPGMVDAVQSAGPVMDGLEHLMVATGTATGDFFTIISRGAPAAGAGLEDLGDLAAGVLPDVGQMLVNLAELWAEHGDQAVRVTSDFTGVISDLSGSALPTLSDGIGIALDVLEGLLNVIEPMSGFLGPLIGLWASLSLAMKGFGAVRGVVDSVSTSVGNMRENFSKAPGDAGKLTKAAGGIMNLLGGPWGLAVAGATALLAVFGQESEDNAADQRSLADALRESGGEFEANARKTLVQSEAYQDIADDVEAAGLNQRNFVDALIEGGAALDVYKDKAADARHMISEWAEGERDLTDEQHNQATAMTEIGRQIPTLQDMIQGAIDDFRRTSEAVAGVSESMVGARPGADSLAEALGVLSDKTADASDHADALNTAWRQLLGIPLTLEEATAGFEGSLANISATFDKAKQSTTGWKDALLAANGQVNLQTEAGRQLSANLIAAGDDYRALAQTAYDTTLQRTGNEWLATVAAVDAAQQRRAQFIEEATQLTGNAALAEQLANRYLGLPDDVLTLLRADSSNAQSVVDGFVNRNNGRTISIFAQAILTGASNAINAIKDVAGVVSGRRAGGGPVSAGQIYEVGEQGRELFMAPSDGQIIPNGQTERFLSGLRAGAIGRARGVAIGDSGGDAVGAALNAMAAAGWLGGGGGAVEMRWDDGGSDVGAFIFGLIRNHVSMKYRGNVQRAFGQ